MSQKWWNGELMKRKTLLDVAYAYRFAIEIISMNRTESLEFVQNKTR